MLTALDEAQYLSDAACERIVDAGNRVPRGAQALALTMSGALDDLQRRVDDARSLGIAEEEIQDALGVWRTTHVPVPAARQRWLRLVR